MAKLKQTVIQSIYDSLDNDCFSVPDFEVQFPDEGTQYVLINFRHDPKYFFSVSEEIQSGTGIAAIAIQMERKFKPHTKESPGDFKAVEWKVHESFDDALRRIAPWCKNLQQELRSKSPALAELEELRKKLEEHFGEHEVADPDARFTAQEVKALSDRFDQLQQRLSELEAQHAITKQELSASLADIRVIKENAAVLPKGIWAKLTKSRLVSLVGKIVSSPEGRKFMLEAAEKALLGHDTTPRP